MIPVLTIDKEALQKEKKEFIDYVNKYGTPIYPYHSDIPLYRLDRYCVTMGIFNEYKSVSPLSEFFEFGYCDTEESLDKYLQQYEDDKDNNYFVNVGTMSMDYEKYYKNGTYINKNGIDTKEDYYDYINEHPEMKVEQDVENHWITFSIYKL